MLAPFQFSFFIVVFLSFFLSLSQRAEALTVNKLNGGTNVIYIDVNLPGPSVPLEIIRSYNSISAVSEQSGWLGAFGWGWTSPFETTLTVTPERIVILRDGGTGNTVTFRPLKEDPKLKEEFFEKVRIAFFEGKYGRKLTVAEKTKLALPDKILARLRVDPIFRGEIAFKYQIPGSIPRGEMLTSSEFGYQTITFTNNQWVREKDGITQLFDKEGRLVRQLDKNGAFFNFKYGAGQKGLLEEISDQDRALTAKLTWRQDRVIEITDNRGRRAHYTYDASRNLTRVVDPNAQVFDYRYENRKFPHLLTRIEYTSEGEGKAVPYREIRYDDSGLVVFHHDKEGGETTYTYGRNPGDPENNFWTKAVRKIKGTTEEIYDEYFIKLRPDGSRYLAKQENKQSTGTTTTVYAACCGTPLQITKNGETTNFKYYENGLLKERVSPKEEARFEYDPRFKKISKVTQDGVTSEFQYDEKGNLVKATNSRKERVALKYDRFGRILDMTDSSNRRIAFQYGANGKPVVIEEKGIGLIKINYESDGRIRSTSTILAKDGKRQPTQAQSQEVVRQVMKGFQNLLDIIRPAGVGLSPG